MARDDDDGGGSGAFLNMLAHPSVVNPLKAYGDAAQVANEIWSTRKAQAAQLAGQAQQGGIGEGGTFDQNRANILLKQAGPGAALAAGAMLESGQRLGTAQTEQAAKIGELVSNALAPLLNLPDDQLKQGMLDAAGRLIRQGVPAALVHGGLLNMPSDPAGMRQRIEMIRQSHLPPQMMQPSIHGIPGTVTTPAGTIEGTKQNPQTGVISPAQAPGTGVRQGLSPAENTMVVLGHDANGLEIKGTAQQAKNIAEGRGMNDNGPGAQSPLGTGRLPPALRGPNQPAPPTPATPAGIEPLPGGGFRTGQAPAEKTAQEASATAGVAAFQEISKQGVAARSRGAVLDNMLSDTTQFTSGPLAAQIAKVRAYAQRAGITVNTEGLSALESFQKLAAQLNTSQGSDARLAVSEASNPHADLSPAGIDLMLRQLRGNEDYNLARSKLAEAHPDQKDSRGFEARVGANLDPRVFQYQRMKPEQKASYFKALDDKDAFIKAHDWAARQRLFGG